MTLLVIISICSLYREDLALDSDSPYLWLHLDRVQVGFLNMNVGNLIFV